MSDRMSPDPYNSRPSSNACTVVCIVRPFINECHSGIVPSWYGNILSLADISRQHQIEVERERASPVWRSPTLSHKFVSFCRRIRPANRTHFVARVLP